MSIHNKQAEEFVTQQQAMAYETYRVEKRLARRRGQPHSVTLPMIEKRFKLPEKSLWWYVGNRNRRMKQEKQNV